MLEYELTRGEGEDKDTINLKDYVVGELYTVKPEVGYFKKRDMRIGLNDYVPWDKIEQEPGKGKKIIISRRYYPEGSIFVSTCGFEFLTNTIIHVLYIGPRKLFFKRVNGDDFEELDSFIYLHEDLKSPTIDEMWDYIVEHEDIEKYREELDEILSTSKMYHEEKAEQERNEANKNKVLIKKIKRENIN